MQKSKIMVVTTGRADYGLLAPLVTQLATMDDFTVNLVATGTHLSPLHGKTIELIERDGLHVSHAVDMSVSGDTEEAICQSIAIGMTGFSTIFKQDKPDLVMVLGDRYELWAICIVAAIHKIPIAHIHGGELTEGVIDDAIRHSVTKMSALHFVSIEQYAKRIIQMGENPQHVHIVGALGIDTIHKIEKMTLEEISEITGVDFHKPVALMTYHPVTLDAYIQASQQIQVVMEALLQTELLTIITMPNADMGGQAIYAIIEHYLQLYPHKFKLIKNLGQRNYLNTMRYAKLMIGNSSSGILESASFKLPVVNIGDRQGGRVKPLNVIDCICTQDAILNAIHRALSADFVNSLVNLQNLYGDGNAVQRIIKVLRSVDLSNQTSWLKKRFYDL